MRILNGSNSLRYLQNSTNTYQSKNLHSLLAAVMMTLVLSSCGKPPKNNKFIPKDASAVVCMNLKKMTAKMVSFTDLLDKDSKRIQNSGLDFNSKAYIFAKWNPKKGKEKENYVGFTFMLQDESKFDSFLRKYRKEKPLKIKSSEGVKYTIIDGKVIVGWANRAVITLAANAPKAEKVWVDQLLKLRDQPESESLLANNKYFEEIEKQDYDAAAWLNWGNTVEQLKRNPTLKFYYNYLTFAGVNFKENYIIGITKFEKGRAVADIKWHMTEALSQYKGLFKNEIDNKLLSHVPAKKPMVLLGLGLHIQGFKSILDNFGLTKRVSAFLRKETGLDADQLFDMLSGDLMAALIDIKKQDITEQTVDKDGNLESRTIAKTNYKFLLGADINNVESMDKLLGKLVADKYLDKKGDIYTFKIADNTHYLFVKDKMLFGSLTKTIKDAVMENKGARLDKNFVDLGRSSAFSMYADLTPKILKKLPEENLDLVPFGLGPSLKKLDTPIESFSIKTSPAKKNISHTKVIIEFTNKDQNSLRSLVEMIRKMNFSEVPGFLSAR
ncbi:DUF4836 family protein [Microscilla marina]|nr:DUF4836 family protein [Microscilla marina]